MGRVPRALCRERRATGFLRLLIICSAEADQRTCVAWKEGWTASNKPTSWCPCGTRGRKSPSPSPRWRRNKPVRNRHQTQLSMGSHAAQQGATRCAETVQRGQTGGIKPPYYLFPPIYSTPLVRSVGTIGYRFSHSAHGSQRAKLPTKHGGKTMGRRLPLFSPGLVPRPCSARSRTGRFAPRPDASDLAQSAWEPSRAFLHRSIIHRPPPPPAQPAPNLQRPFLN